jgi:acyl-CoA thioester hydrolase
MTVEGLLKGFFVIIETPVAWGEMDAFGHVNNIVYFRYFESARMAYLERLRGMEYMKETGIGPILASTQCRFRVPLTYPDTVSVGARVHSIEPDRFTMDYCVVSHQLQKVAAEGSGVIVMFDYQKNAKAALPDVLRQRIEAIERGDSVVP